MIVIHSFEQLECWKKARDLRIAIAKCTQGFPAEERYRLKDQIIRSSRSVSANIAEGFGRHHHKENIQFCRQARASLLETLEHVHCAMDENYITTQQFNDLKYELKLLWKILNGYIAYLDRCVKEIFLRT